jgi:hypothetical protein
MISNGTTVNQGVVANGNVVPNGGRCFFIGAVDHRPVLDIGSVAHLYKMNIASNNGIEPNGAVVPQRYIANHGGIRR